VLIAAYRQQALSANPRTFSRKEDNRGLHPGAEGWMQCRVPGAPESEEQAARDALHEAAERMLLRAVESRSVEGGGLRRAGTGGGEVYHSVPRG
jgi:hypothetical protein